MLYSHDNSLSKTGQYSLRHALKFTFSFIAVLIFSTLLCSTKLSFAEDPPSVDSSSAPVQAPSSVSSSSNVFVSEILFEGNSLTKSKTLEKKIKTKLKKPLDKKLLKDDVKILFETGDFEDVKADVTYLNKKDSKKRDLARVTYTVVERPIIKRIDYKGGRKIKSSAFLDKVQSQEGNPYDRFKSSLDERTILEYYRDEGYANVKVEHYTTLDEKTKKLILTFFIVEGDRVLVRVVTVDGPQRYKTKTILKKMKTRRKKVFKRSVLSEDLEKIENFYKNNGHLDVVVSSPSITIDEERNEAIIGFSLTEGPRYTVDLIQIASSTIFTDKELKKAITLKPGKEFSQTKLDESIANITGLYADKGYLRTEVTAVPERNSEKGSVDFKIDIEESSVVYVDGIYVDGNTYTKTHVIKREVLLKSGDIFSAGRMRRSVEKIYNLGFLDDVQVDVQQPRSQDLADVIFTVKEGKPGILSAGAGFSSVDRFVGTLQVQHTNLFGLAQRLNSQYEFGARRQNFEVGWSDPWFLGYKMSGGIDFFNTIRVRDYPGTRSAFHERRRGVSLRVGPRLSDDLGLLFGYTIEQNNIFDVDSSVKESIFPTFGVPKELALETDSINQVKSSFSSELALDTRDNRFDASRGGRHSVSLDLAGGPFGGDINYYQPQVATAWYFPTFWKFVFSVSARAAWVNSFSPSGNVPTSERFFLGGPDTIRGYDTNSIAPRETIINQNGDSEVSRSPGTIMTLFNFEYKFPIVQERNRTIFQGAFFLDVGGCASDVRAVAPRKRGRFTGGGCGAFWTGRKARRLIAR